MKLPSAGAHLTRRLETGSGSDASPSIWYVHRWPRSLMMSSQTARLSAATRHKLPMSHPASTEGTKLCGAHHRVTAGAGGTSEGNLQQIRSQI